MNDEQLATMCAFQQWVGEDNVFLRPTDTVFTIHCYMGQYDMMTEHVIDEEGWTEPPFDDWDIEMREDNPFDCDADHGDWIVRVRSKR